MKRIKEEYVGSLFDLYDPIPTPPAPTKAVTLYVACSRNDETKCGGWAAIVVDADGQARSLAGDDIETTTCRLGVLAAVTAMKTLQEPTLVQLVTNEDYLFNGLTNWIYGWVENGWGKHQDVWQQAAELLGKHMISSKRIYPNEYDRHHVECRQMARSKSGQISYYD